MGAGFGTILKIGDGATPTEAFSTIAKVKDIEGPGLKRDSIEITSQSSANRYREFIPGLRDGGEISFTIGFDPADTSHDALMDQFNADVNNNFQLILPIAKAAGGTYYGFTFTGHVTEYSPKEPVEDELTADITIKVSGKPNLVDTLTIA